MPRFASALSFLSAGSRALNEGRLDRALAAFNSGFFLVGWDPCEEVPPPLPDEGDPKLPGEWVATLWISTCRWGLASVFVGCAEDGLRAVRRYWNWLDGLDDSLRDGWQLGLLGRFLRNHDDALAGDGAVAAFEDACAGLDPARVDRMTRSRGLVLWSLENYGASFGALRLVRALGPDGFGGAGPTGGLAATYHLAIQALGLRPDADCPVQPSNFIARFQTEMDAFATTGLDAPKAGILRPSLQHLQAVPVNIPDVPEEVRDTAMVLFARLVLAMELNLSNPRGRFFRASAWRAEGRFQESQGNLDKAVEFWAEAGNVEPDVQGWLLPLIAVLVGKGMFEEAGGLLERENRRISGLLDERSPDLVASPLDYDELECLPWDFLNELITLNNAFVFDPKATCRYLICLSRFALTAQAPAEAGVAACEAIERFMQTVDLCVSEPESVRVLSELWILLSSAARGQSLHLLTLYFRGRGDLKQAETLLPKAVTARVVEGDEVAAASLCNEMGCPAEALGHLRRFVSSRMPDSVPLPDSAKAWYVLNRLLAEVSLGAGMRGIAQILREDLGTESPWTDDLAEMLLRSLRESILDDRTPPATRVRFLREAAEVFRRHPSSPIRVEFALCLNAMGRNPEVPRVLQGVLDTHLDVERLQTVVRLLQTCGVMIDDREREQILAVIREARAGSLTYESIVSLVLLMELIDPMAAAEEGVRWKALFRGHTVLAVHVARIEATVGRVGNALDLLMNLDPQALGADVRRFAGETGFAIKQGLEKGHEALEVLTRFQAIDLAECTEETAERAVSALLQTDLMGAQRFLQDLDVALASRGPLDAPARGVLARARAAFYDALYRELLRRDEPIPHRHTAMAEALQRAERNYAVLHALHASPDDPVCLDLLRAHGALLVEARSIVRAAHYLDQLPGGATNPWDTALPALMALKMGEPRKALDLLTASGPPPMVRGLEDGVLMIEMLAAEAAQQAGALDRALDAVSQAVRDLVGRTPATIPNTLRLLHGGLIVEGETHLALGDVDAAERAWYDAANCESRRFSATLRGRAHPSWWEGTGLRDRLLNMQKDFNPRSFADLAAAQCALLGFLVAVAADKSPGTCRRRWRQFLERRRGAFEPVHARIFEERLEWLFRQAIDSSAPSARRAWIGELFDRLLRHVDGNFAVCVVSYRLALALGGAPTQNDVGACLSGLPARLPVPVVALGVIVGVVRWGLATLRFRLASDVERLDAAWKELREAPDEAGRRHRWQAECARIIDLYDPSMASTRAFGLARPSLCGPAGGDSRSVSTDGAEVVVPLLEYYLKGAGSLRRVPRIAQSNGPLDRDSAALEAWIASFESRADALVAIVSRCFEVLSSPEPKDWLVSFFHPMGKRFGMVATRARMFLERTDGRSDQGLEVVDALFANDIPAGMGRCDPPVLDSTFRVGSVIYELLDRTITKRGEGNRVLSRVRTRPVMLSGNLSALQEVLEVCVNNVLQTRLDPEYREGCKRLGRRPRPLLDITCEETLVDREPCVEISIRNDHPIPGDFIRKIYAGNRVVNHAKAISGGVGLRDARAAIRDEFGGDLAIRRIEPTLGDYELGGTEIQIRIPLRCRDDPMDGEAGRIVPGSRSDQLAGVVASILESSESQFDLPTVLIVEDESCFSHQILDAVQEAARGLDTSVLPMFATRMAEAMECMEERPVLVLLDVDLSGGESRGGLDLLPVLRDLHRRNHASDAVEPPLTLLMVTSNLQHRRAALELGADGFFCKEALQSPSERPALLVAIREALQRGVRTADRGVQTPLSLPLVPGTDVRGSRPTGFTATQEAHRA